MFGNLSHLIPATPGRGPPENAPPPTPIHLPQCRPRPVTTDALGSDHLSAGTASPQLTTVLQDLVRPTEQISVAHLELLGVHVNPDASLSDLIPDPSCVPDFDKWDALTREEAHALNAAPQPELCNKRSPPGPAKYVDIRLGLLTDNGRAFRAVNRVSSRPGEHVVRLGYCHEFFRDLETMTAFWDDTSVARPSQPSDSEDEKPSALNSQSSTESLDSAVENQNQASDTMELCKQASSDSKDTINEIKQNEGHEYHRSMAGTAMPAHFRTKLLTSFLKLVTYDFYCNFVSRPGPEPRLHIKSPPTAATPKNSHFPSGCSFLYRTPADRDLVKRGVIDGPIAAVSPRHTTLFPPRGREREAVIDLAREITAALITAQNRRREGQVEEPFGKDAWWATKRRWGGGPGGPVGKEEDLNDLHTILSATLPEANTEKINLTNPETPLEGPPTVNPAPPQPATAPVVAAAANPSIHPRNRSKGNGTTPSGRGGSSLQAPHAKRARTQLAVYDAYRMVRPPSTSWDPRTRYTAIGRQRGVDFDDVFVISCLLHHVSVLRVRVPDRLLDVLGGESDPGVAARGRVEVWRSRWFDFFVALERIEAMKAVWAVMAYSMRSTEAEEKLQDEASAAAAAAAAAAGGAGKGDGAKKDSPRR